ncbi:MAG: copper resistance protein CopC/CopD [Gemmatimonadota bacterium]|nr:copper resistance protein CopC/CopD [Gemmatimonadota bacterium]
MTVRTWRAAGCLAALLATLPIASAYAHTRLSRSSPAAGDTLREAPATIRLWFSGRAELSFTRVRLLRADGSEVRLGAVARLDSSTSAFTIPTSGTLPAGTYTVVWQTAAADGHPVRGRYSFTIAGGPTLALVDTARTTAADRVATMPDEDGDELGDYQVARWAGFIALLAVLGTVVFRFTVLGALERRQEPTADLAERARQIGLGAVVLMLATGVYRLATELRAVGHAHSFFDVTALGALLVETTWGRGWLVGAVGAVVLLVGLLVARRSGAGWYVAAAGALAVAVSPALTGHAAADAERPGLAITVDALHVLGAGAWLGTLLLVTMAGIPAALRRVPGERGPAVASILRAFHPLALWCVPVVVASGLVSAWLRLGSFAALTSSRYGAYLLIKVLIFLCVALTGAYNWRRVLPTLGTDAGARQIRRTASLELAIGAVVLAVTAALVVTSPPG